MQTDNQTTRPANSPAGRKLSSSDLSHASSIPTTFPPAKTARRRRPAASAARCSQWNPAKYVACYCRYAPAPSRQCVTGEEQPWRPRGEKSGEAPGGRGTRRHSPFPAAEVMRAAPAPLQAAFLIAAVLRPVPSSAFYLPPSHTLHVADYLRGAQRLPRRLEDAQPCVGSGGHVAPMAVCRRERGGGEVGATEGTG